jgi:hypothetical protein
MPLFTGDLISIATLAFFTGFGTALGTKLGVSILETAEKRTRQAIKKIGEKLD